MGNYDEKYEYYSKLMDMSYDEAINTLIEKHGTVIDNYYVEKSYNRFLKGEIKYISRGKYTKSMEGLYCHHIFENKCQNLSDKNYILKYKYPYEYQNKEFLVYCDLIEHMILHVLITEETNGEYGVNGLCEHLKPMIIEWYLISNEPREIWQQLCRVRAYLPSNLVAKLLMEIDEKLKDNEIYQYIEGQIDNFHKVTVRRYKNFEINRQNQEKKKQKRMLVLNISEDEYNKNEEQILREEKMMNAAKRVYASLEKIKDSKVPREDVINILAYFGSLIPDHYLNRYTSPTLKKHKINVVKDLLIEEITEVSIPILREIDNMQYYELRLNKIPTELIKRR